MENENLEAQDWGDPNGKGILAAMDEAFDKIDAPQPKVEAKEPVIEPAKEPAKEPSKEPVKEPSKEPVESKLIEESFFDDEDKKEEIKPEPVAGEFDESAFDKETEDSTVGMEAKAGEKFKALRNELKEAKKQVVSPDIQKKLDELELKVKESEGLRARLDEISGQSARLKVENGERYQREVVEPAAQIFSKADELAAMYETEPAILRAIIKERDRKTQNELIIEHLKDFSDFDRNETYRMIQDFGGLVNKRQDLLNNAEAEVQQEQVRQIEAQKKILSEQRTAVQTIQKDIWNKYKDVIPGFVDETGKNTPEFEKLMGKGLSIDFSTAKAKDQAFAAFSGMALPHAVAKIAELQKQLAEYEKGDQRSLSRSPGASRSVSETPSGSDEGGGSFMDKFANMDFD